MGNGSGSGSGSGNGGGNGNGNGKGNAAFDWLTPRISQAPDALRDRMIAAIGDGNGGGVVSAQLAEAAVICLRSAMAEQAHRVCALDLLAADALMTHACEAAAEAGGNELAAFAAFWNADRFEQLLPPAAS